MFPDFKKIGDELQGNSIATDSTTPIEQPEEAKTAPDFDVFVKWQIILDRDKGDITYNWTVLAEMFNDFKSHVELLNTQLSELRAMYKVALDQERLATQTCVKLKERLDLQIEANDLLHSENRELIAEYDKIEAENRRLTEELERLSNSRK